MANSPLLLIWGTLCVVAAIQKIPKMGIEIEVLPAKDVTLTTHYTYDTDIATFADASDASHPFLQLFGELHGKVEFKTVPVSLNDDCESVNSAISKAFGVIASFRECGKDSLHTLSEILDCINVKYRTISRLSITRGSADVLSSTFQTGTSIGVQTNLGLPFAFFTTGVSEAVSAKYDDLVSGQDNPMYHVTPIDDDPSEKLSIQGLKNLVTRVCVDNDKSESDPDDENVNAKNFHAMLPKFDEAAIESLYPKILTAQEKRCFDTGTGKPLPLIKDMVTGCVVEYRHVRPKINSRMLDMFFGRVGGANHAKRVCQMVNLAWSTAKSAARTAKKKDAGGQLQEDE